MDNVIKNNVRSELSTLLKKRYSTVSQHFLKGASNFLIQYNQLISKVVDIKGVALQYLGYMKSKTEKFVLELKKHSDVISKGNSAMASILVGGAIVVGGYFIFRNAMSRLVNEHKVLFLIINGLFRKSGSILHHLDLYAEKKTGRGVLDNLGNDVETVLSGGVLSICRVVATGLNLMLNLDTQFESNTTPSNMVTYLMRKVALAAMKRVLERSNLMTMLSLFGFLLVDAIDKRADLSKFIRHGADVYRQVEKIDDVARSLVNSDAYGAANTKWVDYRGQAVETGDGSYEWDNFGNAVRLYHLSIILQAAEYANNLDIGMGSALLGVSIPVYGLEWDLRNRKVDVEWDAGEHTTAKFIYYKNGLVFMRGENSIYERAKRKINELQQLGLDTSIIRDSRLVLDDVLRAYNGKTLTALHVGRLLYVCIVLEVYTKNQQVKISLNEAYSNIDVYGTSVLHFLLRLNRRRLQSNNVFIDLKNRMESGEVSGIGYFTLMNRILCDIITETFYLKSYANWYITNNINTFDVFLGNLLFKDYRYLLINNRFDIGVILASARRVSDSFRDLLQLKRFVVLNETTTEVTSPTGETTQVRGARVANYVKSYTFNSRNSSNQIVNGTSEFAHNGLSIMKLVQSLDISYRNMKLRLLNERSRRSVLLNLLRQILESNGDVNDATETMLFIMLFLRKLKLSYDNMVRSIQLKHRNRYTNLLSGIAYWRGNEFGLNTLAVGRFMSFDDAYSHFTSHWLNNRNERLKQLWEKVFDIGLG